MIALKKLSCAVTKLSLSTLRPAYKFSQDGWKKRDEAS